MSAARRRRFGDRWRRMLGEDIFISYAREDWKYAHGLADALTAKKFACFIDTLGTETGTELPESLRKVIRASSMLVVVATKDSFARDTIKEEIIEFLGDEPQRSIDVVPVSLEESIHHAIWYDAIRGKAPIVEADPDVAKSGIPRPAVVDRVVAAFRHRRRPVRMAILGTVVTAVLVTVIAAITYVATTITRRESRQKDEARAIAQKEERIGNARRIAILADALRKEGAGATEEGWSAKLQQATLLAIEAAERLDKDGVAPAEATRSLRECLDLLPRAAYHHQHDEKIDDALLVAGGDYYITRHLASGTLRVWNAATGQRMWQSKIFGEEIFNADRTLIALHGGLTLAVFTLPYGRLLWRTVGKTRLDSPRFSGDGRFLAADDGELVVWESKSGREVSRVPFKGDLEGFTLGARGEFATLALTQNGKSVVEIWNVSTPRATRVQRTEIAVPFDRSISDPTFSADGTRLVVDVEGQVSMFAVDTGMLLFARSADDEEQARVMRIRFSPDGRAFAAFSGLMRSWDVESGEQLSDGEYGLAEWTGERPYFPIYDPVGFEVIDGWNDKPVARVVDNRYSTTADYWPPGNSVLIFEDTFVNVYNMRSAQEMAGLTNGSDLSLSVPHDPRFPGLKSGTTLVVWDAKAARILARLKHPSEVIDSYAVSHDGSYIATMTADKRLHLWNTRKQQVVWQLDVLPLAAPFTTPLYFSPKGNYLVMKDGNDLIRVWSVRTNQEIAKATQSLRYRLVEFSSDERFLLLQRDDAALVIEGATGRIAATLPGSTEAVLSPDGATVARAHERAIELLKADGGSVIARVSVGGWIAGDFDFSPDGKYLLVPTQATGVAIHILELATRRLMSGLTVSGAFGQFSFSPRSKYVVASAQEGEHGELCVFTLMDGRQVARIETKKLGHTIRFSPDDRYFTVTDDDVTRMRVVEAATGRIVVTTDGEVGFGAFDPTSRYVAIAAGGWAWVVELATSREIARVRHVDVASASFAPDGRHLTTTGGDGTIHVWILFAKDLIERACAATPANLSGKQWRDTFGSEPYKETCPGLTIPSN
jgi:WD40 repeat protein